MDNPDDDDEEEEEDSDDDDDAADVKGIFIGLSSPTSCLDPTKPPFILDCIVYTSK